MSYDDVQGSGLRVAPLLVLTEDDLQEAVEHIMRFDHFTVDVETDFAPHPRVNTISWVGIAVPDRVFLIPMGHPLGRMLTPETREKVIPPESERKVLKSGALSKAKRLTTIPATFGPPPAQLRPDVVFAALEPVFFSERTKINHNLKFDIESIAKYYGGRVMPGPYIDTLVLTHVLDENLSQYGLKNLIMDWLRVPPSARAEFYPNLGKKGVHLQAVDEVARYLAKDVWYTLIYYQGLSKLLRRHGLEDVFDLEMQLYPVLMDMELHGVSIDTDLLSHRGKELEVERRALAGKIWSICGEQFELTNVNVKRKYLYGPKKDGGQGLKPLAYTEKTNTAKLDQTTLEHYAPTNELAANLLEWTEKDKLISAFVVGLTEQMVNGRLHTSFNQHRTTTGRLSSSKPNIQQIPRGDMRGIFQADDGFLLAVADYDQIELRCAAYLSGDERMIQVFQEGLDIHAEATAAMLDIDVDAVDKESRQVGKTFNFGTLYGSGPMKVAEVANCDLDKAKAMIDLYYERFSGLGTWKNEIIKEARRTGSRAEGKVPYASIPPTGRRRRLPDLYEHDRMLLSRAERQVVNSVVQGFAANIMKIALIDLHTAFQDTPYRLLLNIHDEVAIQAPADEIEQALALLVATMEGVTYNGSPVLGEVPLTADGGTGKRWSEAK
jgi:DNA polymerase I-like protein with 3'-5' exonuclease and polymerase domains